jgi:hypothetical protein
MACAWAEKTAKLTPALVGLVVQLEPMGQGWPGWICWGEKSGMRHDAALHCIFLTCQSKTPRERGE